MSSEKESCYIFSWVALATSYIICALKVSEQFSKVII